MNRPGFPYRVFQRVACLGILIGALSCARAAVVFETYSAYHHIQVVEDWGMRILSFNDSQETRMSLSNPLQGHFEYTEYFHMPLVWNRELKRVLMLGLGGGSTQRSFQHYYTNTLVDTVELDPAVVEVARKYFGVVETPHHKIYNQDGRVFLRRSTGSYDAILMDAYTTTRYGSSVPPHLTTKEFFELAAKHLTTNGVLAYNVIGTLRGREADIVGAIYRTLKEVFPQVYAFPAGTSQNVVLVATRSPQRFDYPRFQREGTTLVRAGTVKLPTFTLRLGSFQGTPPRTAALSPILTDDHAPVESLMNKPAAPN